MQPAFLLGEAPGEDDPVVELEPFAVSSHDASLFEIPAGLAAQMTSLTADDLKDSGALSVVDALAGEAGVHFRSWTGNPAQAEVSLRGFGENSGLRVLVLVDGQRLNRPDMRGVNWLQVPLRSVERIEVVRGATTTLFGNHAVGGVINIITRQGDQEFGGSIEGTGGSYGLWDFQASVTGGRPKSSFFTTVSHQEAEGWRENSAYHATTVFQSVTLQPFEHWQSRWVLIAQDGSSQFPGSLAFPTYETDPAQSIAQNAIDDNPSSPTSYSFADTTIVDVLTQNSFEEFFEGRLTVDFGLRTRETQNRLSGSAVDDDATSRQARLQWEREWGAWTGIMGAEWTSDHLDLSRQNMRTGVEIGTADLERTILSGFTYWTFKAREDLTLSAGLRIERTDLDYDQFISGNPFLPNPNDSRNNEESASRRRDGISAELGGFWRPREDVEVHARVDRFYRYPVTDEIASYQGYSLQLGFNSQLEPEEGYAAEAGVAWRRSLFEIGLTSFVKSMEGEIIYDERERLNVNMPETFRWGLELQGKVTLGPFTGGFFYTFQQATVSASDPFLVSTDEQDPLIVDRRIRQEIVADGNAVPLVPAHKLSAWLELANERGAIRWSAIYTGRQYAGNDWFNQVEMPAYTIVSLSGRLDLPRGWEAFATIDNLGDRRYASLWYATGDLAFPSRSLYSSPPAIARGGLRLTF